MSSIKYIEAVVSDDGSKLEVLQRIEQTTAALKKLKPIRTDKNIYLGSKVKTMPFRVISIFLYACEQWNELDRSLRKESMGRGWDATEGT